MTMHLDWNVELIDADSTVLLKLCNKSYPTNLLLLACRRGGVTAHFPTTVGILCSYIPSVSLHADFTAGPFSFLSFYADQWDSNWYLTDHWRTSLIKEVDTIYNVIVVFRLYMSCCSWCCTLLNFTSYGNITGSTRMGFEPTRAEPNGLAVHRLNHSATSSAVYFSYNYAVF